MRLELELAGETVQFLSVNMPSGLETQSSLAEKCSYPLFQDLEEVDMWGLMNGAKDDFYIYDTQGNLARYYAWGSEPELNLSTDEGYAALKAGILGVIAGEPRAVFTPDAIGDVEDGTEEDGGASEPGPVPDTDTTDGLPSDEDAQSPDTSGGAEPE